MLPFFVATQNIHVDLNTIFNEKFETLALLELSDKFPQKFQKFFPVLYLRT